MKTFFLNNESDSRSINTGFYNVDKYLQTEVQVQLFASLS